MGIKLRSPRAIPTKKFITHSDVKRGWTLTLTNAQDNYKVPDTHHADEWKMTTPPLKAAGSRVSLHASRGGKIRTTQIMKQTVRRSPECAQAEIRSKMAQFTENKIEGN